MVGNIFVWSKVVGISKVVGTVHLDQVLSSQGSGLRRRVGNANTKTVFN